MAWIFGDSFDFYTSANDMISGPAPLWSSIDSSDPPTFPAGRFTGSHAMASAVTGGFATKSGFGSNSSTIFANFAMEQTVALSGSTLELAVELLDGATVQCTVGFRTDGAILFYRGTTSGTVLATFTGAFSGLTWTHFQIEIIFSSTVGEIHIRENGSPTDTFAATGLNNISTANSYTNGVTIVTSANQYIDDFYMFNSTGAAPNTWQGDVRSVQLMAASDPATLLFSKSPAQGLFGSQVSAGTTSQTANIVRGQEITPTFDGIVTELTINLNAGITGHIAGALYTVTGQSLIASTIILTNPSTGLNNLTFSSPPLVAGGTVYFIVLWADTTYVLNGSATWSGESAQALTYTGTFPATLGMGIIGEQSGLFYATVIPRSYDLINDAQEDGVTTYIYDGNVGDEDDFGIAPLTVTPVTIIAVVAKAFVSKSDSGARSGDLILTSGGSTIDVGSTLLSNSFGYLTLPAITDPNTGTTWTETGVNALTLGPKVSA